MGQAADDNGLTSHRYVGRWHYRKSTLTTEFPHPEAVKVVKARFRRGHTVIVTGAAPHFRTTPHPQEEAELAQTSQEPHDSSRHTDDDQAMTDITREELNAKLKSTESRVAAAIARLEAQFASLRADLRADGSEIKSELAELRAEQRADSRNTSRLLHIVLAVMGVVAVVTFGVMGFVVTAVTSSEERMNARVDRVENRIEAGQQRLEDQMNALPTELRGIADSITSAITATQSGQPPVIVIERPAGPEATDQ